LAKKDILYDEGLEFGKRLEQAGCQVTVREWDGYHCFDGGLGKNTKVGRGLRWSQLEWLKEMAM
jgi:acetyl esterase/lipase